MEKIIVFSAPDKQNEAAKETAMQYARLSKEEADRSDGQAARASEEAERAKGYADRIDLGVLDAAVLSTGTDAETALLAKQAAEQAAIDAANDANAQITPNVSAAVAAKNAAEAAKVLSEAAALAAVNSNWTYIVVDNAALLALTGMTADQTAFVKATEHQWKYEGDAWVDKGPSVVARTAKFRDVIEGTAQPTTYAFQADQVLTDAWWYLEREISLAKHEAHLSSMNEDAPPAIGNVDDWWYLYDDVSLVAYADGMISVFSIEDGSEKFKIGETDQWWYALAFIDQEELENPEPPEPIVPSPVPFASYLDRHVRAGAVLPAYADVRKLAMWGSSSIQNLGTHTSAITAEMEATVYAEGKGGERSADILSRMGVWPVALTFPGDTIPADTSPITVSVALPPMSVRSANLKPFTVMVEGVEGTLSPTSTSVTTTMIWARSAAGSAVPVAAGIVAKPVLSDPLRDAVIIMNIGKNDITYSGITPMQGTQISIDATNAAYEWLAPIAKKVVIVSHFVDRGKDAAHAEAVAYANDYLRARYGALFVDVQAYYMSSQVWADTGIIPDATSLGDQAAGVLPTQLSSDPLHANGVTNRALFNNKILPVLAELGVK